MSMAMIVLAVMSSGCSAVAVGDRPAVLVQADAAQQARIQEVIALALEAPSVDIAADALTTSSELIIESEQARSGGQRLQGRVLSRPEHFQLLIRGSQCILMHVDTQRRHALQGVRCRSHAQ